MSDHKQAIAKALSIDGWLTEAEASSLHRLASESEGPVVEIGSWRGRSTAALALGSMSGNKHPVYAVDSFIGVPELDRPTADGECPGWKSSSPEILRANLDAVGVNGLVRIIPKPSELAAPEIPDECGVIFVDGDHSYEAVKRDIELYGPKVRQRGYLAFHDCAESDPEVIRAVDEIITADNVNWRPRWRVDSLVVYQRVQSQRHKVMLGFPGSKLDFGAAKGLMQSTLGCHTVALHQSGIGWDDMARLWVHALNEAKRGACTHFAMLHSDVQPSPGWIDLLIDELDDRDGDFISAAVALKDENGLTSCGIGDASPWGGAFRRFTTTELLDLPETFSIEDTPHPERYLLHNTGCFVADLRKPIWRMTNDGVLICNFAFPIRAVQDDRGFFQHQRESEDWHFSRQMSILGAKTFATRRVSTIHYGVRGYSTDHAWGRMKHDEQTRDRWESCPAT